MDYGHIKQSTGNQQGFFTPGVGLAPENDNPLDASYNIDNSEFQPQQTPRDDHDYANMGKAAINSQEVFATNSGNFVSRNQEPYQNRMPESNPNLGQIVNLEMPPTNDDTQTANPKDTAEMERHFADGKISQDDINYIKKAEDKLSQDDNIADFYDFWLTARQEASSNSRGEIA